MFGVSFVLMIIIMFSLQCCRGGEYFEDRKGKGDEEFRLFKKKNYLLQLIIIIWRFLTDVLVISRKQILQKRGEEGFYFF
jgi:hypothetical protein